MDLWRRREEEREGLNLKVEESDEHNMVLQLLMFFLSSSYFDLG